MTSFGPSPDPLPEPEALPLSEREGWRPRRERWEPVPQSLDQPLRAWLGNFLHPQLQEDISLRLGLELAPPGRIPRAVGPPLELARHPQLDVLDAIDLALQWDEALATQLRLQKMLPATDEGEPDPRFDRLPELTRLDRLLDVGGSTFRVEPSGDTPRLLRRLDLAVDATLSRAVHDATGNASRLLHRARVRAYGLDTSADGAYLDALRAVETLACPLVLPDDPRRTLNKVTVHLRADSQRDEASRRWELLITKRGVGSVDPLVEMFDRLWHGNLASRHGDEEPAYREVTLDEARAAVVLAATCVQWLSDGILRLRIIGPSSP